MLQNTRRGLVRLWSGRRLASSRNLQSFTARIKLLFCVLVIVIFVAPFRNFLVPYWPHVFRDMSTFKVIHMYVADWFFYVNTTQYDEPCDFVHKRLSTIKMPELNEMVVYKLEDWNRHFERIKPNLSKQEAFLLDKFKPSMSIQEQKYIMFAMLSATQAMTVFNITHIIRGGTLIGYWRHHGRMPWDEDVDILVSAAQWELARAVLSCLPNLQVNLGPEYMWKLFHKDAALWKGESFIRFPYVDIFLYNEDSDHVWPLTIWMKMVTMKRDWALPPSKGVFEGWPIAVPNKPAKVLHDLYPGDIMSDCYSQIFHRRERRLVPTKERVHIPCSMLRGIYPLVTRRTEKETVIEERTLGSKILSTINTSHREFF